MNRSPDGIKCASATSHSGGFIWTGVFGSGTRITFKTQTDLKNEDGYRPPGSRVVDGSYVELERYVQLPEEPLPPMKVFLNHYIEGGPMISDDSRGEVTLYEDKDKYWVAFSGQPRYGTRPNAPELDGFPKSTVTYQQEIDDLGEVYNKTIYEPKIYVVQFNKHTDGARVFVMNDSDKNCYFTPQFMDGDRLVCIKYSGTHNGITCCMNMESTAVILRMKSSELPEGQLEEVKPICTGNISWLRYVPPPKGEDIGSIVVAKLNSPLHFGVMDIVHYNMHGKETLLTSGANNVQLNLLAFRQGNKIVLFYRVLHHMREYVEIVVYSGALYCYSGRMLIRERLLGRLLSVVCAKGKYCMIMLDTMSSTVPLWDIMVTDKIECTGPNYVINLTGRPEECFAYKYSFRLYDYANPEYAWVLSKTVKVEKLFFVLHGGPHVSQTVERIAESPLMRFLMDQGLVIGLINFTGSTHKTNQDVLSSVPMDGSRQAAECTTVIENLCSEFGMKLENCIIYGGSYGGFLSCYLANSTPVGAAIIINPVTNFYNMLYTTDIPSWTILTQEGTKWEECEGASCVGELLNNKRLPEFQSNNIALTTENVECPCLMMLGAEDRRVPCHQGLTWIKSLKARKKKWDAKLLVYPYVGHSLKLPSSHVWLDLEVSREVYEWTKKAAPQKQL